jgi:hypothetical protein
MSLGECLDRTSFGQMLSRASSTGLKDAKGFLTLKIASPNNKIKYNGNKKLITRLN